MRQSINKSLYKLGSKRGLISAIVSSVGVMISGLCFRYGLPFLHTEAIPIIIFIGFILGGILLELIVFRLIVNEMLEINNTEVKDANDAENADEGENPLDDKPSNAETNTDTNVETES